MPLAPLCAEGESKGESKGESAAAAAADSNAGGWHTRPRGPNETMIQSGVIRVNCIDCLDRTNLAQRTAGHFVLAMQLTAMGLQIAEEDLNLQTLRAHHLDLVAVVSRPPEAKPVGRVLESLYEDLGDHISLQYAGSTAHRKVGAATEDYDAPVDAYMPVSAVAEDSELTTSVGGSSSRAGGGAAAPQVSTPIAGQGGKRKGLSTVDKLSEVVTSVRRHISNTFTDTDKQHSLNLFLGVFEPRGSELSLWEFWEVNVHDRYLHNRAVAAGARGAADGTADGAANGAAEPGPLTSASADVLPTFDCDAADPGEWWAAPLSEWRNAGNSAVRFARFAHQQTLRAEMRDGTGADGGAGADAAAEEAAAEAAAAETTAAAVASAAADAAADAALHAPALAMDLITHSSDTYRVGGPLLRRFSLFEQPEGSRLTSFDALLGLQTYKPTRFVSTRWGDKAAMRRLQARTRSQQTKRNSTVSRGIIWGLRDQINTAFTPVKSGSGSVSPSSAALRAAQRTQRARDSVLELHAHEAERAREFRIHLRSVERTRLRSMRTEREIAATAQRTLTAARNVFNNLDTSRPPRGYVSTKDMGRTRGTGDELELDFPQVCCARGRCAAPCRAAPQTPSHPSPPLRSFALPRQLRRRPVRCTLPRPARANGAGPGRGAHRAARRNDGVL